MDRAETARLLWIEAEDSNLAIAGQAAEIEGFTLIHAAGIPEGLEYLMRSRVDAVVICFPLPGYAPIEALEELRRADGAIPAVLWDPGARLPEAVRLIKSGAFDVWGPETELEQLVGVVRDAFEERRSRRPDSPPDDEPWRRVLVGSSRPFQEVVRMVRLVGGRRSTVLITGQTGTGKEMVARALHMAGPREPDSFSVSTSPMRTFTLNSSPSRAVTSASVAPAFTARATTSAVRDSRSRIVSLGRDAGSGMSSNYQTRRGSRMEVRSSFWPSVTNLPELCDEPCLVVPKRRKNRCGLLPRGNADIAPKDALIDISIVHPHRFDVLILGAGAAGLMAAIEAGRRGRRVAVLERSNLPGKKILISGGGRCNFTNLDTRPRQLPLRQSPLRQVGPGPLYAR